VDSQALVGFGFEWMLLRGFYICGGSSWGNLQMAIVALFQARCILLESLSFERRGWYRM
jgi:hypothetical protein